MTPEPKSAEDAAIESLKQYPGLLSDYGEKAYNYAFMAGVAWQREREALLVEALENILKSNGVAHFEECANLNSEQDCDCGAESSELKARAALLKYRGGE